MTEKNAPTPKEQARIYLAQVPGSIEGQAGSGQCFYAARLCVQDFGLDDGDALDLLRTDYNPRCVPPWSDKELRHKIEDAQKKIDPSKLGCRVNAAAAGGSKAGDGAELLRQWKADISELAKDLPDPIDQWAKLRGFSPGAVAAMGGRSEGGCVAFPMFIEDTETGIVQRNGTGAPFAHSGEKSNYPKGTKKGLLLSVPALAGIPDDARVVIAEGPPNCCALADAGEQYIIGWPDAAGSKDLIPELVLLLAGHVGGPVVIVGDAGKAGVKLVNKIGAALAAVDIVARVVHGIEDCDLDVRLQKSTDRHAALAALIDGAVDWEPSQAKETGGDAERAAIAKTDLGNAERFAKQHKGKILYDRRADKWRVWDGTRWALDTNGTANRLAHQTARSIYAEAANPDLSEKDAKLLGGHAARSESFNGLSAMVKIARDLTGMSLADDQWDAGAWLLNALNGIVDLKTGELLTHDPAAYCTRLAPVRYDPDAKDPRFDQYLADVLPDDDCRRFIQRAAGYSCTGDTREESFFLAIGPTATGKTTLLESMKSVLGDYAVTADFESFTKKTGDAGARNDIARLAGARLVTASESEDGKSLAAGLIKNLTGGELIPARFLFKEAFEFMPTFKIWFATNYAPKIKGDDDATWRRLHRLPFERSVPKDRRDRTLKPHLKDPEGGAPAVLAWMVAGCLDWQAQGLNPPQAIEAATASYQAAMNPLAEFIEDCCALDPDARTQAKELRARYENWFAEQGIPDRYRLNGKAFAQCLKAAGCESKRTGPGNVWRGISICVGNAAFDPDFQELLHERESIASSGKMPRNAALASTGTIELIESARNGAAWFNAMTATEQSEWARDKLDQLERDGLLLKIPTDDLLFLERTERLDTGGTVQTGT